MLTRRIALPAVVFFLSSPAAMADPPPEPWPINAVVVFTQEAISDMAALPNPEDIKTPADWIVRNMDRANDGLESRNLDEYAEFVAVNEENQVLVLDDENGDPYSEANVGYGTMNSDIENILARVNSRSTVKTLARYFRPWKLTPLSSWRVMESLFRHRTDLQQ